MTYGLMSPLENPKKFEHTRKVNWPTKLKNFHHNVKSLKKCLRKVATDTKTLKPAPSVWSVLLNCQFQTFWRLYRDNHITIQHTLTSHCRSWCWCWCRGSWHCAKIEQKTFISIRIIYSKKHLIKLKGKIYPHRFSSYLLPLLCAGKALIKLHLKNNSNLKNHT